MKIEIGLERVLEEIYALSALQGYASMPQRDQSILQEDQREGLVVLIADAFAEMVAQLMPRVADYRHDDDGDGDMWIEFHGGTATTCDAAAALTAKVLASMVMGAVVEGTPEAAAYERKVSNGIRLIAGLLDVTAETAVSISPYR